MEAEFVAWLRARLPAAPRLRLGIGDDAALLTWAKANDCVVTADTLLDGVDFDVSRDDARLIGRKALAVNLSDLAAMAARPVAAVVALALPREGALMFARELYEGLLPLAEQFSVAIAGGDTNVWEGRLAIAITAIGETTLRGPLRRDGAKPGDAIVATGSFGGSRLGKQFTFEPRIRAALDLNERFTLHAGIDVSDGLSLDLSRLCAASGVGAELDLAAIPIAPEAQRWAELCGDGQTALDHALGDGEDFELILTLPPAEFERLTAAPPADIMLTRIGTITATPGVRTTTGEKIVPRGWEY